MEKTATLNLRVNPALKQQAEEVLYKLGVPMSTAINIYLNQITLTGGIPFAVTLPKAPDSVNMDKMTAEQLYAELQKGFDEMQEGKVHDAKSAFKTFEESRAL